MGNIVQFRERLNRINNPKYLELVVFTNIKKLEKVFLDAQKEQLGRGEDYKGEIFGTYTPATERMAKEENTRQPKKAGEPYNFEYYGGFFDGMVLDVFEDGASFFSDDPKTEELIKKYKGLFGLQADALYEIIRSRILPAYLTELRQQLLI